MSGDRLRWLLRRLREASRDNQWLIPSLGAMSGFILALLIGTGGAPEGNPWTVSVDRSRDTLFGALGLVFTSLSIVLALASVSAQNVVGRYGSRVMRIYFRRSPNRWVVGLFGLASMFILTEQFQLRRLDPDAPAPIAGLVVSVVLLVITGALVIAYIASVVRWFRVDRAVAGVVRVARRAARTVARHHKGETMSSLPERPANAIDIPAPRKGHLAEIDADVLLGHCRRLDAQAVITAPIGAPVVEGQSIGWIAGRDPATQLPPDREVGNTVEVIPSREVEDNIEYGLFGLVDIAIMALSPAVNDPNSAVEVIEEMSFLFQDLAGVPLGPYAVPDAESWPRAVVRVRTFGELVDLATTQIVLYGITDPNVVRSLRQFADALRLLELSHTDLVHVDAFAAKLEGADSS